MNAPTVRRHATRLMGGLLLLAAVPTAGWSQRSAAHRVGILPLVDASGSASRGSGSGAAQVFIDGFSESSSLVGVVLKSDEGETIDQDRAVAIGRAGKVRYVLAGTVLEATSKDGTKGGWLPRIKGQTLQLTVRSLTANVTLQGSLYDVTTGERLLTTTVKGSHTDRSYGGRVWATWGSWDVGDYHAFLESPMGKAYVKAARSLIDKIHDATAAASSTSTDIRP